MIRKVRLEEIPQLYPFVFNILSEMELPLLDNLDDDLLNEIIIEAMKSPNYRFGYDHAWVCEQDSQIVGVLFGYPGEFGSLVDGPLEVALVNRGLEPIDFKSGSETHSGEWYLDSVVVSPIYRRKGIAHRLLQTVSTIAKDAGYDTIGLNCPVDNVIAYKLYSEAGFIERTKNLLGGKVYLHLSKDI